MEAQTLPRIVLKGDVAESHYNLVSTQKQPSMKFQFLSRKVSIGLCCVLSIWLSICFIFYGLLAFFLAHIVASILLIYLFATEHYLEWYQDKNEYVFIRSKILSRSKSYQIYHRLPADYISMYKSKASWQISRHYTIRSEEKDDLLKLDFFLRDEYRIKEFSQQFNFSIIEEAKD